MKKRSTVPIKIHKYYHNRGPAMQYLLEETETLLKTRRLPRNSTKLCVGGCLLPITARGSITDIGIYVVTAQTLETKLYYEVTSDEPGARSKASSSSQTVTYVDGSDSNHCPFISNWIPMLRS